MYQNGNDDILFVEEICFFIKDGWCVEIYSVYIQFVSQCENVNFGCLLWLWFFFVFFFILVIGGFVVGVVEYMFGMCYFGERFVVEVGVV